MSYECFDVEIADGIAHLRMKRPQAYNTMTRGFWMELPAIVRDIDDNARARVIVISSTGKHFSAGMDLSVFTEPDEEAQSDRDAEWGRSRLAMRNFLKKVLQETFNCLDEAQMPVLAAIQGGCIGGAVDFTSACDMRYATEDAFFCIQEINIGMTADVGTFPRLCHLIPQGWVRELAYTGRRLSATQARDIGLVNTVYPDHETMVEAVMQTAREIAARSPLAVTGSKAMINYARDHSIADGLDYIATWQTGMYYPQVDMMESFKAQAEGREPSFDDLQPLRKKM